MEEASKVRGLGVTSMHTGEARVVRGLLVTLLAYARTEDCNRPAGHRAGLWRYLWW